MKWMHHYGVDNFDDMTNIGKALREKLKANAEIRGPEVVSEDISRDGTRKWVVRVASGSCVETVYIPQNGRGTLCVSSQAGCALDCSFCSTGKQGFNSDLTVAEIIGQVWIASKSFGSIPATADRAVTIEIDGTIVILETASREQGVPVVEDSHVVDQIPCGQ